MPAGSGSTSVTVPLSAELASAFVASMVNVSCEPTVGVADVTDFVTETSANCGVNVTEFEAPDVWPELFVVSWMNEAVLVIGVVAVTSTLIVKESRINSPISFVLPLVTARRYGLRPGHLVPPLAVARGNSPGVVVRL
jgi:hypothetical protein